MTPGEAAVMKASAPARAERGLEVRDVRLHRAAVLPVDGAGARRARHRRAAVARDRLREVRPSERTAIVLFPSNPVSRYGRRSVATLPAAVADDVHAGTHLPPDDVDDRAPHAGGEGRRIVPVPASIASSVAVKSSGRGRLPVWVVRMRSVLCFMTAPPRGRVDVTVA